MNHDIPQGERSFVYMPNGSGDREPFWSFSPLPPSLLLCALLVADAAFVVENALDELNDVREIDVSIRVRIAHEQVQWRKAAAAVDDSTHD